MFWGLVTQTAEQIKVLFHQHCQCKFNPQDLTLTSPCVPCHRHIHTCTHSHPRRSHAAVRILVVYAEAVGHRHVVFGECSMARGTWEAQNTQKVDSIRQNKLDELWKCAPYIQSSSVLFRVIEYIHVLCDTPDWFHASFMLFWISLNAITYRTRYLFQYCGWMGDRSSLSCQEQ